MGGRSFSHAARSCEPLIISLRPGMNAGETLPSFLIITEQRRPGRRLRHQPLEEPRKNLVRQRKIEGLRCARPEKDHRPTHLLSSSRHCAATALHESLSASYFRYSCSIKPLFSISLKKLASTKSAGAKFLVFGSVSRSSTAWSALSLGAGNRSNRSACSS
jgi:hypothetical protein